MAKKILIGNYKGGVGKTISTICIGSLLSKNFKVLLIDLDPQSSLSEIVFKNLGKELLSYDYDLNYNKFINYAYELFIQMKSLNVINEPIIVDKFRVYNDSDNVSYLDVLPNSLFYRHSKNSNTIGLDDIAMLLSNDESNLMLLPKLFNDNFFDNEYDYIFFDTPPSSNIITQSAFLFADYLLIPTICDEISQRGIEHYLKKIDSIYDKYCVNNLKYNLYFKKVFGNKIEKLGTFETMRKGNAKNYQDAIWQQINNNTIHKFDTKIKDIDEVVKKAYSIIDIIKQQINIGEGDGREEYKRGYKVLCDEIIKRLNIYDAKSNNN